MEEGKSLELGNIIFNTNKNQSYNCPNYVIALLGGIEARLQIEYWDKYQKEMSSPFRNTGNTFKNETFEVQAYEWDEDISQDFNFKWKDIEISWYKNLGRDTTINQKINPSRAAEMFDDCIKSLDNSDNL